MTKVIIEHDMHVVFSLADKISVLSGGRIIAEGLPDDGSVPAALPESAEPAGDRLAQPSAGGPA